MLRHVTFRAPSASLVARCTVRSFAAHRAGEGSLEPDEEEVKAARKWLANLDADAIRQKATCDVSFSRSSGPGGQNVNKVSSKATLRIPTSSLLPLLPKLIHQHVLNSRYHAAKSADVVVQADDSRKQTDNLNTCFRKLHDLIVEAVRAAVPGETSAETTKRVEDLQKAEKLHRRKAKEYQSKKKSARRGGGRDD
ncbi:hypothetical protein LTR37_014820 [Vermiconidia calcicola]|uniref:Uncharacterized protein n=1 Tax=Vermiconidia calcicola TaxID=1690605 RepID=A0ACC3MTN8_9PEZI|nr:hypothetical protein LTR37_014820 [Vermiconidia calcicola]